MLCVCECESVCGVCVCVTYLEHACGGAADQSGGVHHSVPQHSQQQLMVHWVSPAGHHADEEAAQHHQDSPGVSVCVCQSVCVCVYLLTPVLQTRP